MLINKHAIVKLCDFGICRKLNELISNFGDVAGTDRYLPPTPEYCTIENDMWALGMTLYEILTGTHPFANSPPNCVAFEILFWKPTIPTTISEDMQQLISHL